MANYFIAAKPIMPGDETDGGDFAIMSGGYSLSDARVIANYAVRHGGRAEALVFRVTKKTLGRLLFEARKPAPLALVSSQVSP